MLTPVPLMLTVPDCGEVKPIKVPIEVALSEKRFETTALPEVLFVVVEPTNPSLFWTIVPPTLSDIDIALIVPEFELVNTIV